jgi:hypothetical protein
MSILSVDNKILRYKGISYQILQITSMKVVEIKVKNRRLVSLKPLKILLPILVIGFSLALIALLDINIMGVNQKVLLGFNIKGIEMKEFGLIMLMAGGISGVFSYIKIISKIREIKKDKYRILYGLSLRMSNGDDPLYRTSDKKLIFEIQDAITYSMNNSGESKTVSFDNANIEIIDAGSVEIGNIVRN